MMLRLLPILALFLLAGCERIRTAQKDMPWTPLSLSEPIGWSTGRKLAALTTNAPKCLALLDAAGVRHAPLPPVSKDQCGYADGVTLERGGALDIRFHPGNLGVACPVAAALTIWQREVVQPAATRHFGKPVVGIDHYGSFSCRRINGRPEGDWSEHATADAIDIAGFRLKGGDTVSIRRDWTGNPARAAFLREVRDGGCKVFATVLSPDYNAAHADHLHMDQAARGRFGSMCA
ncbi:extensin family protein [Sandarakinorhabdus sp. DWP1-3-1]|uniref:extensin-like domain-containing protein n=1 Tax=Sandarakinorhabdus sp. DWP1-3-1 TaxID=2804627 RepID=UPI003CF0C12F